MERLGRQAVSLEARAVSIYCVFSYHMFMLSDNPPADAGDAEACSAAMHIHTGRAQQAHSHREFFGGGECVICDSIRIPDGPRNRSPCCCLEEHQPQSQSHALLQRHPYDVTTVREMDPVYAVDGMNFPDQVGAQEKGGVVSFSTGSCYSSRDTSFEFNKSPFVISKTAIAEPDTIVKYIIGCVNVQCQQQLQKFRTPHSANGNRLCISLSLSFQLARRYHLVCH